MTNNGKVNVAESAEALPWTRVTGKWLPTLPFRHDDKWLEQCPVLFRSLRAASSMSPDYPNRGRSLPKIRDAAREINRTPSMNMAPAVTTSAKGNDNLAEVVGSSLHTATTDMVLQDITEATIRRNAAIATVNASVLAFGLRTVLAAVSPARRTHATIAAIPVAHPACHQRKRPKTPAPGEPRFGSGAMPPRL